MPTCPCSMCQCSSLVGLMYHCYYPLFWRNATQQKGKILRISVLDWSINGNLQLFCIKILSSTMRPSGALSLVCSGLPCPHAAPFPLRLTVVSMAALEEHDNCLHAVFSSARSFSSSPVLKSWWFPVTFWTYTSVSCMLQSSSLFLPCYEPAHDGWALSMPWGAAGAVEEVKTADLLQQISSNSRLCCGSSVECHHFNCSLWNSS